jgi:uncharacterized protein YbbK (DUF523 family)
VADRERTWLVSACLLGASCRYDGKLVAQTGGKPALVGDDAVVPVCPEVAGGLAVPRAAADLRGGDGAAVLDGGARVHTHDGRDVTAAFLRGADLAVEAARRFGATHACLKARSPSCGCGAVWRDGALLSGDGVTAAALKRAGLTVLTDEDMVDPAP